MGRNRIVIVGTALLLGGCAVTPTRSPPSPLPESASAPKTMKAPETATIADTAVAAPAAPIEAAAPASNDAPALPVDPRALSVDASEPAAQTNGTGGSNYGPGAHDSIVTAAMQISSSSTTGGDTNSIAGQLGGGYFLTDNHEVGGQLLVNYIAPPGPNSTIFFLAPYYNYNYRLNPRLTVYGGPHLGYARFESAGDDTNSFQIGLQAGARYWLASNTAAFAEWRYTHYKAFGDSTNDFTMLLGLAYTF